MSHLRPIEDEERDLIERLQQGESQAFRPLYDKYKDKVFSLCLHMLGDYETAKDFTQQIFLKVFTRARTFHGQSAFGTWLYRMSMNECLDHLRHRRLIRWVALEESSALPVQPSTTMSPDATLEKEQICKLVQDAVQTLSPKLRSVIVLKYVNELSYADIAAVLGCSMGTVASRLNFAHKTLAKKLEFLRATI